MATAHTWFTPEFNRFFKELAPNNNKEWFDANRKRYEQEVKAPFEAFVGAVISEVAQVDPKVRITPREAIFRINRDIRFSKDKAPYKSRMSAIVSPAGRHDHTVPGLYFELGPESVAIYGGAYMPDKEELLRIRRQIAANLRKFRSLTMAGPFVDHFGTIQGERNKVLPAEFKELVAKEPLLANKQFYWSAELPAKLVTDPGLLDRLMAHYRAMRPLNEFLAGR